MSKKTMKTMTDWERFELNQSTVCTLLDKLYLEMIKCKERKIKITGENTFTKDVITVSAHPQRGIIELQMPKIC